MKTDDLVQLKKVHPSHNRHLKKMLGQTGTVVAEAARKGGSVLVRFDDKVGSQFWVKPRWLAPAPAAPPPPTSTEHVVDPETGYLRVVPVTDVELAFPVGEWQPEWDQVPDSYKNQAKTDSNGVHAAVKTGVALFYGRRCATEFSGIPRTPLLFRDGSPATAEDGWRMIRVIMGSYRFKQEHKEALLGWAIDSVFEIFWFAGEEPPEIREALAAKESESSS